MAQECGFFNARMEGTEYDRVYNAEQFADYFASFIGNGVFGNTMSELVVRQNDTPNMSVNVASGKAWINGWWYKNTDDYNLSIDVADGVLNRIDVVVLRWGNAERDMWAQVIKGTPSANPIVPSIIRDSDYYDLKLCEVSVPAGSVNIRQAQITDTRAISEVCGFVTGLIDQIDVTDLFLQFQAQFGDFMSVNYEEFNTWFNYMKDQLTEDAAGHLQAEVDGLSGRADSIEETVSLIRSHIGMIIQSTTLDTEAKVKAIYGGTTWTQIEGRFLLGASSSHAVNSTGGAETVTLTVNQMPSHNHGSNTMGTAYISLGSELDTSHEVGGGNLLDGVSGGGITITPQQRTMLRRKVTAGSAVASQQFQDQVAISATHTHASQGGGQAHNNMPPYKAVYIWERTA